MVWRSDGHAERTPIMYLPSTFRNSRPGTRHEWSSRPPAPYDPVTDTNVGKLESSNAAHVARDIYQYVLDWQGTSGPLADRQLQRHVRAGSIWDHAGRVAAFWSPDGKLGRAC